MSQGSTQAEQKPQSPAMHVHPSKEHRWLQKLVGEWTYETEEKPGVTWTGTETVRPVGDIWVIAEGRGQTPGGKPATTMMTLGFDPQRKRFVGTWLGSMMTHLWLYEGELDATEGVLTLHSEGPSMSGDGTMAHYQDIIEFKTDDHRLLNARVQGKDGVWQPLMTVEYRRRR